MMWQCGEEKPACKTCKHASNGRAFICIECTSSELGNSGCDEGYDCALCLWESPLQRTPVKRVYLANALPLGFWKKVYEVQIRA